MPERHTTTGVLMADLHTRSFALRNRFCAVSWSCNNARHLISDPRASASVQLGLPCTALPAAAAAAAATAASSDGVF
jgi:hypothetical protein